MARSGTGTSWGRGGTSRSRRISGPEPIAQADIFESDHIALQPPTGVRLRPGRPAYRGMTFPQIVISLIFRPEHDLRDRAHTCLYQRRRRAACSLGSVQGYGHRDADRPPPRMDPARPTPPRHGFRSVNGRLLLFVKPRSGERPMQIVCPSCATSYRIDHTSVGKTGRSVRCARCRTIWFATATTGGVADPDAGNRGCGHHRGARAR